MGVVARGRGDGGSGMVGIVIECDWRRWVDGWMRVIKRGMGGYYSMGIGLGFGLIRVWIELH